MPLIITGQTYTTTTKKNSRTSNIHNSHNFKKRKTMNSTYAWVLCKVWQQLRLHLKSETVIQGQKWYLFLLKWLKEQVTKQKVFNISKQFVLSHFPFIKDAVPKFIFMFVFLTYSLLIRLLGPVFGCSHAIYTSLTKTGNVIGSEIYHGSYYFYLGNLSHISNICL